MKDNEIISLFELRDEHAIEALSDKYHPYRDTGSCAVADSGRVEAGNTTSGFDPWSDWKWKDADLYETDPTDSE